MNYDMKRSGDRIRRLRIEKGLTQEKVAEALNIDQSFYGRVESGKKGCSVDLFIQLSALFNVSLDYLILGRYSDKFLECTDAAQLKVNIENLINQLESFKLCL